jgi:hypothetical protein
MLLSSIAPFAEQLSQSRTGSRRPSQSGDSSSNNPAQPDQQAPTAQTMSGQTVPGTPYGLNLGTPLFGGLDWSNSPFILDAAKGLFSIPGTPGTTTPTGNGRMLNKTPILLFSFITESSSMFDFPSSTEDFAAGVLLSAKRNKRRSSIDLLDAAFSGTPLFSPNGTSHDAPPRPSAPVHLPPVLLAPAPKGRRADRIKVQETHNEDDEGDDLGIHGQLDKDDEEYKPSIRPHAGEPRGKRAMTLPEVPLLAAEPGASATPLRRTYENDDDDDDTPKRHKRPGMKRDGDSAPETTEDMMRREGHVCQALQVADMDELFRLIKRDECFLVTVYPCKDPACNNRRKTCVHRVNRFQSTRNSKRHVHAYLYYKMVKGLHTMVPDETIRLLWKWLESSCPNGLKNANGHGKATDGRICVNPYHYTLHSKVDIDALND